MLKYSLGGNMAKSEGKVKGSSAPYGLPTEVSIKPYPKLSSIESTRDDTMRGIDAIDSASKGKIRKHSSTQK